MALDNLISVTFTNNEVQQTVQHITDVKAIIGDRMISLTPDQRRQYGRIANQNKLIVNKAKMHMEQNPSWVPGFLDKEEFDRDYDAREKIEAMLILLENLTQQLVDTKTLLDHDNYNNSLSFYRYLRYLSSENEPGAGAAYRDMKPLFAKTTTKSSNGESTEEDPLT